MKAPSGVNVNIWLLSLLSGFLGAIVGALVYGWVALRGIEKQIAANFRLKRMGSLQECIPALRALVAELAQNRMHLIEKYEGYRALALSMVMWQTLAPKLGPVSIDTLKKISLAYAYVSTVRSTEEAIRSDLHAQRPAKGYQFIQETWNQALGRVDEALAAIGEQARVVEQEYAESMGPIRPVSAK